jgi:tetratricopeptide (TPR) repeat protein
MTAAPQTPPPDAAANATRAWLYGPLPDLLLGCCLWYVGALVVFAFAGEAVRLGGAMSVLPFAVLIFSTPHYGATLLRVYERSEDRRGYRFFTVYASLALAVGFAFGVHNAWIGSFIITLYVTWSPWHYSGQNYGLAMMFLHRRGIPIDALTKRFLHASFVLSYVLAFLALHGGGDANHFVPVRVDPLNYQFLRIGLPASWSNVALGVGSLAYAVALGGAALGLLRRGSLRSLAPTATLVLIQGLWFSLPLLFRHFGAQSIEPWTSTYGSYYFLWIAIGHSTQYLWITSYYARGESHWTGQWRYFTKTMLAGAAIWTVPTLIFAPGLLGRVPYDGGFALLAAAIVNLHHFVLDGAIWKLRDGRVARMLLRARDAAVEPPPTAPSRSRWIAPAVWTVGLACFGIMFFAKWERQVVIPAAAAEGDVRTVRNAVERLSWVGRDSAKLRRSLGDTLLKEKNFEGALREHQRANQIRPSVISHLRIAQLHEREKRWELAVASYRAGLGLNPHDESLLYNAGLAYLQLGDLDAAEEMFSRATEANPDRAINRTMLEKTRDRRRTAEGA